MNIEEFEKYSDRDKQALLNMAEENFAANKWIRNGIIIIFLTIASGMYGCPQYNVWQQGLEGEAELARAQQNRQIKIEEAQAKLESADLLAEAEYKRAIGAAKAELAIAEGDSKAEIARADGAAKANDILADSLGGSEAYLRWLYIQVLKTTKNQLIYLPTEAGLPILEAGKR